MQSETFYETKRPCPPKNGTDANSLLLHIVEILASIQKINFKTEIVLCVLLIIHCYKQHYNKV